MRCPACTSDLDIHGKQIAAGVMCTRCSHLWRIEDGRPVAINAGNPLMTTNPAPAVDVAPAMSAAEAGVMTAAKAACFIKEEIG